MSKKIKKSVVKYYDNPYKIRKQIYKEDRKKSGIYCWYNIVTGEIYIGSSSNLTGRMYCYLYIRY